MGASGLFNCLTAVEATRTGLLPPTHPECETVIAGMDVVAGVPRQIPVGAPVVVSCAAFGGNYAAVVVGHASGGE
jgi:hypothetical protein